MRAGGVDVKGLMTELASSTAVLWVGSPLVVVSISVFYAVMFMYF